MYRKEFYVLDRKTPISAVIRNYNEEDFDDLIAVQQESFPHPFPSDLWWEKEQLRNHVELFPQGALCAEINGRMAGSMTSHLVHFQQDDPDHTWEEVTDGGYIRNHQPDGNSLYVVDICVRPSYRKLGIGKCLMNSMYEIVVHHGLERLIGGGRMPGYHEKCSSHTPEAYLESIVKGEFHDPVITFLMSCGRVPVKVVENYLEDEESRNCAVLMEWRNPFSQKG
ncbi:GNAT family N-acetyltransferase [Fictibacillus sp. S7]|uniref:GNAT family N-acetyltransferase n=1 Tax=Fictibacillus sp. S7 TaxID=2212476 RepID=UPI00101014CC|nr:GNAT family N-acetyltransferase [Fictibacillus sp. S7]RXZ01619.1 GNAT family N-acetyltransferase [Fictibacillus sp. S7]